MTKRTLWLADHELRDQLGHHLNYNTALAEAALAAGWETTLLCQRDFRFAVPDGVGVRGIFRPDWRSRPPAWIARSRRALDFLEKLVRRRFRNDLAKGFPASGTTDIVFAQMLAPRHLAGWVNWLADTQPTPALVAHLGYDPFRFAHDAGLAQAFARTDKGGAKIRLISDSIPLAAEYERLLQRPVAVLPHVVPAGIVATARAGERSVLTFSVLGNPRREKGFVDLAAAIEQLASQKTSNLRFVLQVNDPDDASAPAVQRLREAAWPHVELIEGRLSEEDYLARLHEADVLVVPYHLDKYGRRTSGIFCEALVAGKPVLATEGSWMSAEITREGVGWLVPERQPSALAAGIVRAAVEFDGVKKTSLKLAPRYRQEFSGENFLQTLIRLVDHDTV